MINRLPKDTENPYVRISKQLAEDQSLTYEARGMMLYLLAKPDNWRIVVSDLVNSSPAGKAKVYSILNELKDTGYIVQHEQRRDENGNWLPVIYTVNESPLTDFRNAVSVSEDSPLTDSRDTIQPYTVNRPLITNNPTNNQINKESNQREILDTFPDDLMFLSGFSVTFGVMNGHTKDIQQEVQRIGKDSALKVVERCVRAGGHSWNYVLKALQAEVAAQSSAPAADQWKQSDYTLEPIEGEDQDFIETHVIERRHIVEPSGVINIKFGKYTPSEVFALASKQLQLRFGNQFDVWMKGWLLVDWQGDDCCYVILVNDMYKANMINTQYRRDIERVISDVIGAKQCIKAVTVWNGCLRDAKQLQLEHYYSKVVDRHGWVPEHLRPQLMERIKNMDAEAIKTAFAAAEQEQDGKRFYQRLIEHMTDEDKQQLLT